MIPTEVIAQKRDGHELPDAEIHEFIEGFVDGRVADYQMSAFAMATYLRDMTARETAALTRAMLASGTCLSRVSDKPRVDKHSTGGLGDKVSLILGPLLAAADAEVPMISGRGLGHTGGTLDKLESIPGFRCDLDAESRETILRDVGVVIVGADKTLAPADQKLYALRDVTATVGSIPLITASILSKKLAESLDALVMDVKVGNGAFMQSRSRALELAESLQKVGNQSALPISVVLSDMDQPLGQAIGNAIEVNESIEVLSGEGPREVRTLTVELAASLLVHVGICRNRQEASTRLEQLLDTGHAREKFEQMIYAQGGRLPTGQDAVLNVAPPHVIVAEKSGYLSRIDCLALGRLIVRLGGGRRRTDDRIDPSIGMTIHHRIGDFVQRDEPLLTVHAHKTAGLDYLETALRGLTVSETQCGRRDVVLETLPFPD